MNLPDAIGIARDELFNLIPETDLILPGGTRPAAAAYVHIHLPLLHAGLEGFDFRDAALTDAQQTFASLNPIDRRAWVKKAHEATQRESEWHSPMLSRATSEWLKFAGAQGGALDKAINYLPPPLPVITKDYDQREYGVIVQREGAHFLVPMSIPEEGKIGAARPVVGLGAGLSGPARTLADALVGDIAHLERGIAGNWQHRPLAPTRFGPVMLIGNDFQVAASELERDLARNAVERFIMIHEKPRDKPAPSLRVDQNITPVDQLQPHLLTFQGFGRQ